MLEIKTQFEVNPALTVIDNCQNSQYILFLGRCICLLITSLQYYLQHEQANFNVKTLEALIDQYQHSHLGFMSQTEQLLNKLVEVRLMEPSFDIGLISKLKTAKRFYQKAQSKWEAHFDPVNLVPATQHYFHNISSSLIYCVDVHMDALRFCEAALASYKRQALAEEIEIEPWIKLKIDHAMSFLNDSKKQNLSFREILVKANLHISHDSILAKLIIELQKINNNSHRQLNLVFF